VNVTVGTTFMNFSTSGPTNPGSCGAGLGVDVLVNNVQVKLQNISCFAGTVYLLPDPIGFGVTPCTFVFTPTGSFYINLLYCSLQQQQGLPLDCPNGYGSSTGPILPNVCVHTTAAPRIAISQWVSTPSGQPFIQTLATNPAASSSSGGGGGGGGSASGSDAFSLSPSVLFATVALLVFKL